MIHNTSVNHFNAVYAMSFEERSQIRVPEDRGALPINAAGLNDLPTNHPLTLEEAASLVGGKITARVLRKALRDGHLAPKPRTYVSRVTPIEIAAWMAARPSVFPDMTRGSCVYFIQEDGGGPIKIGKADNPRWRLDAHQISNPRKLVLLGWTEGNHKLERELHGVLAAHRIRGEWFAANEHVLSVINELMDGRKGVRADPPLHPPYRQSLGGES